MDSRRKSLCALLVAVAAVLLGSPAHAYLTDEQVHTPPDYYSFKPPAVGGSYTDPVFGSEIVRMSDGLATSDQADGGKVTYAMNEYATMSAVNDDGSWIILQHDSYFALYDGQGRYVRDLPLAVSAGSEPRWSRKDPNVFYFINGNTLKRHDVSSGSTSVVRTFSEYGRVSGKGESDICFDGDHLVLSGDDNHIFVYEISSDTKGPVLETGGRGFDSLYITPDDNVTVSWYAHGSSRYNGIELYDRSMRFQRQLTTAGGHMDMTRDTDGSEVLVWTNAADKQPICDNGIVKVRLSDAKQTCLLELPWSLAVHISCSDGDGSCIVGTYIPSDPSPGGNWPVYGGELLQVMLDGSEVRRLAHHRSRPMNGYNYTPRASVNRDGTRLVFSSNYGLQEQSGYPTEYSDAYLIELASTGLGGGGGGGSDDGSGGGGDGSDGGDDGSGDDGSGDDGSGDDGSGDDGSGDDGGSDDGGSGGTGGGSGTWTRAEESASSVVFTGNWYDNVKTVHSGGSAKLAQDAGSRVAFTFEGTGARWLGYRDAWAGVARVWVDGEQVATVDTYQAQDQAQAVLHEVTGLPAGTHTLEVEVLNQTGPSSSGAWIWVDAFEAIDNSSGGDGGDGGDGGSGDDGGDGSSGDDGGGGDGGSDGDGSSKVWLEETASRLKYRGLWFPNSMSRHRGGGAALATDRGSRVRVPFRGTGIRWVGYQDGWSGIARVYLDGKLVKKVDTYASPDKARQTLFSVQDLPKGRHVLTVWVTGRHSRHSAGSWIWIDGFEITRD
ncbi:MAG: hypothetical protein ACLF0P_13155 [Thermoanaerobaculia bacterium]